MDKKINIFLSLFVISIFLPLSLHAYSLSDQEVTHKISLLLEKESGIPNTEIAIYTNDGTVTLSGKINTRLQANHIIELVSSVKSVIDVNIDKLEIVSSRDLFSDSFITAKAKGRIKYLSLSKKISSEYDLHIETTNKVVHIFGKVKEEKDIERIKNTIESIKQVDSVCLNIKCE